MNLYQNELYMEDVRYVADLELPWNKLQGKKILLSGATGLLGSFLVDVLMERNLLGNNISVYALGRDEEKVKQRFSKYKDNDKLIFIACDVKEPFPQNDMGVIDYVFHFASNTHPIQYSTDPIGTITTNIIGLQNMLNFAVEHQTTRFSFASSNEIYGENRGDVELFSEDYCGYIDCNTVRAGYPESKRCGEALCQAYKMQKGLDVVIPRFTRSYGPTMLMTDTKAVSQFIKKSVSNDNIVLKSEGIQFYSYLYVADSISGFLTVLLLGENGEAYNIAECHSDITLKELAGIIAQNSGIEVVYEIPNEVEKAGYSKATKARLNGNKLSRLGWKPKYDIQGGILRTVQIIKDLSK